VHRIILGNVLDELQKLPSESVHCILTSPPYYGLRSYGTPSQIWGGNPVCEHDFSIETPPPRERNEDDVVNPDTLQNANRGACYDAEENSGRFCSKCGAWFGHLGLEPNPIMYIEHMTEILVEAKRVLRNDGTFWLNIGDSYVGGKGQSGTRGAEYQEARNDSGESINQGYQTLGGPVLTRPTDNMVMLREMRMKPKDLMGIPWMLAFALRDTGWWLRQDIIWAKKNCMPESVKDRCTRSHEYVFLLTKSEQYYYDWYAIREPAAYDGRKDEMFKGAVKSYDGVMPGGKPHTFAQAGHPRWNKDENGERYRNKRDVWFLSLQPFKEAHFATFPPDLIRPMILAGTSQYGACSTCGAPWERCFEDNIVGDRLADGSLRKSKASRRAQTPGSEINGETSAFNSGTWNEPKSTGWRPTCSCEKNDPVPCKVMDIFNGSGTSGIVCLQESREYIGIELKPEYVEMSERRLDAEAKRLKFLPKQATLF